MQSCMPPSQIEQETIRLALHWLGQGFVTYGPMYRGAAMVGAWLDASASATRNIPSLGAISLAFGSAVD